MTLSINPEVLKEMTPEEIEIMTQYIQILNDALMPKLIEEIEKDFENPDGLWKEYLINGVKQK